MENKTKTHKHSVWFFGAQPKKNYVLKHSLFATSPSNSNRSTRWSFAPWKCLWDATSPHQNDHLGSQVASIPEVAGNFNDLIYGSDTVDGRNPVNSPVEVGSVSHFFEVVYILGISSCRVHLFEDNSKLYAWCFLRRFRHLSWNFSWSIFLVRNFTLVGGFNLFEKYYIVKMGIFPK